MPTTEQDLRDKIQAVVEPYANKLKRVAIAASQGELYDEPNPNGTDMISSLVELIQLDRIEAKLGELKFCKKYMISTSPFIERIIDPRIAELESQKNQLKGETHETST